jgi:hypothetical protein
VFLLWDQEVADFLKLGISITDVNDKILTTPVDPNAPGPQPIRWTNNVAWRTAEIEFKSKFPALGNPPPLDPKGETHFVTKQI